MLSLADVCYTANAGRSHFSHRLAIVSESRDELEQHLQAAATGAPPTPAVLRGEVGGRKRPRIALLFPGQGCQHANMGRQLFLTQPTFRAILERCAEVVRPHLDAPLLDVLYGGAGEGSEDRLLNDSAMGAAALFALEYGLAELWSSWGVSADVVMGYGVGEYVAACVAVLLQPRRRAEAGRDPGAADAAALRSPFPCPGIDAGGVRGGSGAGPLQQAPNPLGSHGRRTGRGGGTDQPRVLGRSLAAAGAARAGPGDHSSPGRPGVPGAGPRPILVALGRQHLAGGNQLWLPSLSPPLSDWQQLATSLAQLYVKGVAVDWRGFDREYRRRKVALPSYPFQRQRYWLAYGSTEQAPPGA